MYFDKNELPLIAIDLLRDVFCVIYIKYYI